MPHTPRANAPRCDLGKGPPVPVWDSGQTWASPGRSASPAAKTARSRSRGDSATPHPHRTTPPNPRSTASQNARHAPVTVLSHRQAPGEPADSLATGGPVITCRGKEWGSGSPRARRTRGCLTVFGNSLCARLQGVVFCCEKQQTYTKGSAPAPLTRTHLLRADAYRLF